MLYNALLEMCQISTAKKIPSSHKFCSGKSFEKVSSNYVDVFEWFAPFLCVKPSGKMEVFDKKFLNGMKMENSVIYVVFE